MLNLTEIIGNHGPTEFSIDDIAHQSDLFSQRSALYFTPTKHLPEEWIGSGPLDVILPIVSPDYYDCMLTSHYRSPKLWVDLLQRATGKLRWRPNNPVCIEIVRYDTDSGSPYLAAGAKALIDSLKVKTSGRSDGKILYYFGAIEDDVPSNILECKFSHIAVSSPSEAKTRIILDPVKPNS